MTAELSYHDKKGYYGLRVNPSYEEMLHSLKKKVWIPQPDRSAKWYATGPYRAFLLDQAKRFNDAQRKDLKSTTTRALTSLRLLRTATRNLRRATTTFG